MAKQNDITQFKYDILFKAIHNEERSDSLFEKLKIAERFLIMNKDKRYHKQLWYDLGYQGIVIVFKEIILKIIHTEKLLILIDELKEINYETNKVVEFNPYYYEGIFKNRIKDSKTVLRKLRPYILEETKEYTLERKQKDIDSDIGSFYKGWYII